MRKDNLAVDLLLGDFLLIRGKEVVLELSEAPLVQRLTSHEVKTQSVQPAVFCGQQAL